MHRVSALTRATLGRALFAALLLSALQAMADEPIGAACTGGGASAQAFNGSNAWCNGSAWQYPALLFGSASAPCNATNAGIIQWNGSGFVGCNGGAWLTLGQNSDTLGSSTTANPSVSGAVNTGLYTAGAAKVDIGIAGSKIAEWLSSGLTITGIATANSFIPAGSAVPSNGMYLSAPNTVDFSTSSTRHLEISSGGNLNIAASTAALQLGGTTILTYPDAGSDSTSLAISTSALGNSTTVNQEDTAAGYLAGEFVSSGAGNTAVGQSALLGITGSKIAGNSNTAMGDSALKAAQGAAASNTAAGQSAGLILTTGSNNTIFGAAVASTVLTIGSGDIFIGASNATKPPLAGTSSAIGIGVGVIAGATDVGIGYEALRRTVTDNAGNTAVGYRAIGNGTLTAAAVDNVAIGSSAGSGITSGYDNVAIGSSAGGGITSGYGNVAIGWGESPSGAACCNVGIGVFALNGSTGSYNTGIGYGAGSGGISGQYNVFLGPFQGYGNAISGSGNTGVGETTLEYLIGIGANNTTLGFATLNALTTGSNNTVIGYEVAQTTLTTGSNNILIGTTSGVTTAAAGTNNFVSIGNLYEGDASIGHTVFNGALPTTSSGSSDCGTSPAIAGNDNVGVVTVGTSTNGGVCTIKFHTAWTTKPVCFAMDQTTANLSHLAITTTSLKVEGTLTAGDSISYRCAGYQL